MFTNKEGAISGRKLLNLLELYLAELCHDDVQGFNGTTLIPQRYLLTDERQDLTKPQSHINQSIAPLAATSKAKMRARR